MNMRIRQFLSVAALALALCTPALVSAQPAHPPTFSTTSGSPPADQEFSAVLRVFVGPSVVGLENSPEWPAARIDGNVVSILFDMGCFFICPNEDPLYRSFPLTMPALPAGPYVVRFVGDFTPTGPVYAEFNIVVGNGNGSVPASLPLGGAWNAVLGGLLLLVAFLRARQYRLFQRSQV